MIVSILQNSKQDNRIVAAWIYYTNTNICRMCNGCIHTRIHSIASHLIYSFIMTIIALPYFTKYFFLMRYYTLLDFIVFMTQNKITIGLAEKKWNKTIIIWVKTRKKIKRFRYVCSRSRRNTNIMLHDNTSRTLSISSKMSGMERGHKMYNIYFYFYYVLISFYVRMLNLKTVLLHRIRLDQYFYSETISIYLCSIYGWYGNNINMCTKHIR